MLRLYSVIFALLASAPFLNAANGFAFGAHPLSSRVVSMWLLDGNEGGDSQSMLLVYFIGPEDWHQQRWESKYDGNSEKQEKVTYRLQSASVTLEVAISADRKKIYVQGREFSASDTNVVIVNRADDPPNVRIEALGHFTQQVDSSAPLSVAILRENPELKTHLE